MVVSVLDAGTLTTFPSSASEARPEHQDEGDSTRSALGASRIDSPVNLAGVDLNLLVALDALLDRCNVTHAASLVGLSQPAMSRALSRLRGMFNDDLLVRTSAGYVRTIRGEQLHDRLPATLDAVRDLIASRAAGSEGWRSAFRMAMPDHQALVLLPLVWDQVNNQDVNTELVVEPLASNLWKKIENGELEVAIGQFSEAPNGFFQRTLFKDRYVCLLRRDHPFANGTVSADDFYELQHAVIAPGCDVERSFTDVLSSVPQKNRCILSTNVLGTAMAVVESDSVLTMPSRVASKLCRLLPLQILDLPIEVAPYEAKLLWHERSHRNSEHSLMRSQIAVAAQFVTSGRAVWEN